MRFMMLLKADKNTEAGIQPEEKVFVEMGKYNEELLKAGALLSGEGLQPSSKGARITFSGGQSTVTDGPFTELKELIAGFWIIQVNSKAEAIEWARRAPLDGGAVVEIRQIFEYSDFENLPAEIRETYETFDQKAGNKS